MKTNESKYQNCVYCNKKVDESWDKRFDTDYIYSYELGNLWFCNSDCRKKAEKKYKELTGRELK
jgi:hypothetical protein